MNNIDIPFNHPKVAELALLINDADMKDEEKDEMLRSMFWGLTYRQYHHTKHYLMSIQKRNDGIAARLRNQLKSNISWMLLQLQLPQ